MADLSHFTVNSDYTAIKEVQDFTINLTVSKRSVAAFSTYDSYADIYVPAGYFIENITIYWSYSKDTTIGSSVYIFELFEGGPMTTTIFLYRVNATTYRLRHYVVNMDENAHNAGGYTITAKAHLFTTSG